jgi:hypothetical protein
VPHADVTGVVADEATTPDTFPVTSQLVPLSEDEYVVGWPDGKHRGQPIAPDPVRGAQDVSKTIVTLATTGLGLGFRVIGLGFRIVGFRPRPLALDVGPIGRAAAMARRETPLDRFLPDREDASAVTVRSAGSEVELDAESLDRAFPHATERVAVFVSSIGSSERTWGFHGDQVGGTYASRLAGMLGWTPVFVRVDAQATVAEAGVALAAALQRIAEEWPVDLQRIALLGHGAGGLVGRAACGLRNLADQPWTRLVSDVLVLDTPTLAKQTGRRVASRAAAGLDHLFAGVTDADAAGLDTPLLDGARYVVVTDEAKSTGNPIGRALGSMLWWRHTATGRHQEAHQLFPEAEHFTVSTREFSLVNHPDVHRFLLSWLT